MPTAQLAVASEERQEEPGGPGDEEDSPNGVTFRGLAQTLPSMSATHFGASRRAARLARTLLGGCASGCVSRGFFPSGMLTWPKGADIKDNGATRAGEVLRC